MGVVRIDADTVLVTTGRGKRLVRVDLDGKAQPVTGAVEVGPRAWGLALAPDGALAFTANGPSNDVTLVDARTMTVAGRVKVGTGPWGVLAVR
jgi:YVTN family beta-propeller protein